MSALIIARIAVASLATVVFLAFIPPPAKADPPPCVNPVITAIEQESVCIGVPGHWGSGVLITREGATYVLTAGHVASNLGEDDEATLYQPDFDGYASTNRVVGRARLLKMDPGHDLAVLRCDAPIVGPSTAFDLEAKVPPIGTVLLHVGGRLGIENDGLLTRGVISQIGRAINGYVFDTADTPTSPGSSGGGMFLEDGRYAGMLLRGSGDTISYFAPIRRIRRWLRSVDLEFLLEPEQER